MATEVQLTDDDGSSKAAVSVGMQKLNQLLSQLQTSQCKADDSAAWGSIQNPASMSDLVQAWRKEPGQAAALLSVIESLPGHARRARSLRTAVKRSAAEAAQRDTSRMIDDLEDSLGGPLSLAHALDAGAPPIKMVSATLLESMTVPRGYAVDVSGVYKITVSHDGEAQRTPICTSPIFICGRTTDVSTGEARRQLVWRGNSGWMSRNVTRRTIMDCSRIIGLADFEAPVNSMNTGSVVAYLAEFESTNGHRIPSIQSSSTMGWQPNGGFLLPDVYYTTTEIGDYRLTPPNGLDALAAGWRSKGDEKVWFDLVDEASDFPIPMLLIYASLAAPLAGYLDVPGFVVDVSGETSGGKTSVLRLAASVWGRPGDAYPSAMYSWDGTLVWFERTAGFLHNLPLILDETKRARSARIVRDTIYAFCHGQGRGRGSLDGTRHTPTWQSVLISSGEGMATSFSEDAGTRARVVSLTGKPLGSDAHIGAPLAEKIRSVCTENHGFLGRRFVHYLVANRERRGDIKSSYESLRDRYSQGAKTAVGRRHASHLALLNLAAIIAEQLGLAMPECDPFAYLLTAQAKAARDADRPLVALQDVMGWCAANESRFWGRHRLDGLSHPIAPFSGWAGAWVALNDWPHVHLIARELKLILSDLGHDPNEVISRWVERGWIQLSPKGGTTVVSRINGSSARCYRIGREAADLALIDD